MDRFKPLLLLLLATLIVPADLAGQNAEVRRVFPGWHATFPTGGPTAMDMSGGQSSSPSRNTSATTNDYRWEGLIIGGVAVGLFGAALGASFCGYGNASDDDGGCFTQTLGGGLMGALVGGVTGGLVGSQISR